MREATKKELFERIEVLEKNQATTDYHDFSWPDMPLKLRKKLYIGPLYINGIKCRICGYFVRSRNHHDMRYCKCGACAVDGGSSYGRMVGDRDNYEVIQVPFTHLSEDES